MNLQQPEIMNWLLLDDTFKIVQLVVESSCYSFLIQPFHLLSVTLVTAVISVPATELTGAYNLCVGTGTYMTLYICCM